MIHLNIFRRKTAFAGIFLAFSLAVAGQDVILPPDDPNLDQIPHYLLQETGTNTDAPPLSSVITIGNWDNFNLGIDEAENNMAANPSVPTWYFTAYNTNRTHHTENGHDWGINNPNFGANMWGDPVVVYDSLGNLFYMNMYGSGTIQGCKMAVSQDNGFTWPTITTAISGIDKNWVAADQTNGPYANYVYATMTSNSGGNFSRSTDHGQTWTTTFSPGTQSLPGMMACVGAYQNTQGGAVYVVTNGGSAFSSTYTFYRSLNGGSNFQMMSSQQFAGYVGSNVNNRHSIQNMRTRPYPFIAADNSFGPHRGRLYCVNASNDPPGNGNKPDIWCRYSDNGGTTWSSAVRVNDDPNPTQHNQWHPAIWCDKETGRLYVQWMDTRDTPTSDSALIYATYSDNGGVTFAENQPISNKKMKINCSSCPGGGSPRYQGDYNGIISNKKVGMAGWTDFRNGSFMSTTAYFPDFAMAINKIADTLYTPFDTTTFLVNIPEVKLYADTVVVSATIFPVPTAGTITASFPAGTMITSFPNSLPVQLILTGPVPAGNYTATFIAEGPNGTPIHKRGATIRVMAGSGFAVNATADPDSICQGASSQLGASVYGGTAPFTYQWTPTAGLSNPNIANPVASPGSSTKYFITVTDNTLQSASDSILLTVLTAPSSPGPVGGPSTVCKDSTSTYEVAAVPGAISYSWTVPGDATIVSGQNTPVISVLWGSVSGVVSVIVGNECGNSPPSTLNVTVSQILPAPGPILGPELGCIGVESIFGILVIPGAESYEWSVPLDATITGGQGTEEITVIWGETSGNIAVTAQNYCGDSPPSQRPVTATHLPDTAGPISGNDSVCVNHTGYQYTVPVIQGAITYQWTLPTGASISAGQGTSQITVDFSTNALSGDITVSGMNDCGDGGSSTKSIIVSECAGIQNLELEARVEIYPNPAGNMLYIRITGKETDLGLMITDITGKIKYSETMTGIPREYSKQIDLSGFSQGVYFIRFFKDARYLVTKFVIRR